MNCRCYNSSQLKSNILDCSKSGLTSLSDIFILNTTNWFVAENNKIDHLEWSVQSSRSLHHIDLANCSIYSIGPNFFWKIANLTKVRYLNLAGNKLKGFNQDITKSNFSEIYLSENPIECNCDMLLVSPNG